MLFRSKFLEVSIFVVEAVLFRLFELFELFVLAELLLLGFIFLLVVVELKVVLFDYNLQALQFELAVE